VEIMSFRGDIVVTSPTSFAHFAHEQQCPPEIEETSRHNLLTKRGVSFIVVVKIFTFYL